MFVIANNENIAKGTTDPRVEFILKILIKFQVQNLDQALTSKSQPNISIKEKLIDRLTRQGNGRT